MRFLLLPQLTTLTSRGFEVTTISAPGPWVDALTKRQTRHVSWPSITRSWHPSADIRAFFELLSILKAGEYDLVHTHNPKPGLLGRVAARLARVPCVVNTVHGLYTTPTDGAWRRTLVLAAERFAGRFSDLELYQSGEDLRWAREKRLAAPEKLRFLGNGIDIDEFSPARVSRERRASLRRELSIRDDAVVVGTVGRLVAEKGYHEFFVAARAIAERFPDVVFVAVGDPDPDKSDSLSPEEIAANSEYVRFTGWRENIRDILSLMDVFVLASWREGVPRSLIEAAAMQLAAVATNIRGCREVIRDGIEGILVEPRDATSLTDAISTLVQDADMRRRFGAAARERAVERFDERRVIETVLETYDGLLRRKGLTPIDPGDVMIRYAKLADARRVAELHGSALPDAFLPQLGTRFLTRLYRALVQDPDSVVVVAQRDESVIGFCAGTRSVSGFYRRFLRRHGASAVIASVPALLRPSVIARAVETARYPTDQQGPEAELLAVAIEDAEGGQGTGRRLASAFLDGLTHGTPRPVKVVVAADNERANTFYRSFGFELLHTTEIHKGTSSHVWTIEWPS